MIRVTLRGDDEQRSDLATAKARFLKGVPDLMESLSQEVETKARGRARRGSLTGQSANSIRAMGPQVSAGSGVPWYNFADFGGRVGRNKSVSRPFIKGGRWLFPAVADVEVGRQTEAMLDKATKELQ